MELYVPELLSRQSFFVYLGERVMSEGKIAILPVREFLKQFYQE